MTRLAIAVLISGRGSNLQTLLDACATPGFPARIALVISNIAGAAGLERAERAGVPIAVVSHKAFTSREAFDAELKRRIDATGAQLVCLAGFMRLLSTGFVTAFHNRMINIHPSLLPAFPGLHTHQRVLAAGVRFTGCTVHFVRAETDAGPIIVQAAVPVLAADTPETLGARVLASEHACYPQAVRWIAEGRVVVDGDRVTVRGAIGAAQALINPAVETT